MTDKPVCPHFVAISSKGFLKELNGCNRQNCVRNGSRVELLLDPYDEPYAQPRKRNKYHALLRQSFPSSSEISFHRFLRRVFLFSILVFAVSAPLLLNRKRCSRDFELRAPSFSLSPPRSHSSSSVSLPSLSYS